MKKLFFCLIALFVLSHLSAAAKRDSLNHSLTEAVHDTTRIDLYLQLGDDATDSDEKINYYRQALRLSRKNPHYLDYQPFFKIALVKTDQRQVDSVAYLYDSALVYALMANDTLALAKIYHSYGVHMRFIANPELTLEYTHRSRLLYQALRDSFQYYRLLNNEALMHRGRGHVDTAKMYYQEILTDAKHPRDSWIIAAANLGYATISKSEGDYEGAITQNLQAYQVWKSLGDTAYYCKALNNLALMYMSVSMSTLALDLFEEIIEVNPQKDDYAVPLALANMASLLGDRKEFERADSAIDSALVRMEEIGNLYYITVLKMIKAEVLVESKRYKEAEPYLAEAFAKADKHRFSEDYGTALLLYAELYYEQKAYALALEKSKSALKHAITTHNFEEEVGSYAYVGKSLYQLGQISQAAPFLLKAIELNDSLLEQAEVDKLKEAAISYELGKKEAVNEALKKEAELNKTILEKTKHILKLQRFYLAIAVLFLLFALVFLWVLHRNNQVKKKMNADLLLLNQELDQKNASLHEMIAVNNKIFSIISHDLRSPLVAMHSSVMLLKNSDMPEASKQKVLAMAEGQVDSTLDLFENLLRWSKTHKDGIKVNLSRVLVSDIIQDNIELVQTPIHNKSIHLDYHPSLDLEVKTDPDLFKLIVRNVLSNAIKFTPRGGKVIISAELEGAQFVVKVSDTGVGISKDQIAAIFHKDEFLTNNGTENEKGSGLGLKICVSFIKQLGGEMLVSGLPNQGSVFTIKLPTNLS